MTKFNLNDLPNFLRKLDGPAPIITGPEIEAAATINAMRWVVERKKCATVIRALLAAIDEKVSTERKKCKELCEKAAEDLSEIIGARGKLNTKLAEE